MIRIIPAMKWLGVGTCLLIVTVFAISMRWEFVYWNSSRMSRIRGGCFTSIPIQYAASPNSWRCARHSRGVRLWGVKMRNGVLKGPLWIPFVLIGTPTALLWWRDRRPKAGFCKVCKYDLTGNVSGICPECGASTSP